MLRAVKQSFEKRPLITNMIASGLISGGGDALSQLAFEKRGWERYDVWRTGRFFVVSSFLIAPALNKWFRVLERIRGPPKIVPLKRLAVDQLMFSPVFNGFILVNLRLLEGFSLKESFDKMTKDWPTIYGTGLMVWPLIQLVNFYFVPLSMRVLIIQFAAFFWNSFLSYKTQAKPDEPVIPA